MEEIEFILYVLDQEKSTAFYEQLLYKKPSLNVPGMTEFELFKGVKLGLMPENGIAKIIQDRMPHPHQGNGIPRCELYIKMDDAKKYMDRAVQLGGKEIDALKIRDWGDSVGYISDLDGHIIAFAEK